MRLPTTILSLFCLLATFASAAPAKLQVLKRQSSGASVDLTNNTGTPTHYASGLIFGVPEPGTQIPDHFYTDIGFNFNRGNGAQLQSPSLGYVAGVDQYEGRWQVTLDAYHNAQRFNAPYIMLLAALYGDTPSGTAWPGDNGNWTIWDAFVQQVISDMKAAGVDLETFIVEIHNETDGVYWQRPQSQYLELWRRTYVAFKQAFTSVTIQGPSSAGEPSLSYGWWTTWAQYISQNNVVPDTWTWHMESGGGNMLESQANLFAVLDAYNLPHNNININEYATYDEEVPCAIAWWIAQLERVNIPGLRGNWLSGDQLDDFLANLISKPGAPNSYDATSSDYFPVGEFQVYKYYNLNMTGNRLGTLPSSDGYTDVYATNDPVERVVKVLAGNRNQQGDYNIAVGPVSSTLGLASEGNATVAVWAFTNNGKWGEIDAPTFVGTFTNEYSGDVINLGANFYESDTTYSFEISY